MLELLTGKPLKGNWVPIIFLPVVQKEIIKYSKKNYVLFLYTDMGFERKYLFHLQEKILAI